MEIKEVVPKQDENKIVIEDLVDLLFLYEEEHEKGLPIIPKSKIKLNLLLFSRKTHYWRYFLLYAENECIGFLKFSVNLVRDKNMSSIQLFIQPKYRRRGFAKYFLKKMIPQIPENVNILEFMVRQEIDQEFSSLHNLFQQLEGKLTYFERINVSDLSKFNAGNITKRSQDLIEKAKTKGYKIVFYENGSFSNDSTFEFPLYISLMERINNDMPREESSWEDETWDEEILMQRYKTAEKKHEKFWAFIAIHEPTNTPAGMTEVIIQNDFPTLIDQMETGVIAEHRGNKLGLTLKYAALNKILHDPLTKNRKLWKTENASSNKHMLAINDELGYHAIFSQCIYEIPRHSVEDWVK